MKKTILLLTGFMLLGTNAFAKNVQYEIRVDGMTCPFCSATTEKALKKIKGVYAVSTDLEKATISVCVAQETEMTDEKLAKLLKKKGFTYVGQTRLEDCTISPKKKKAKTGFLNSGLHKYT